MMHVMANRKTTFEYLAVHASVADRIRTAARSGKTQICKLLEGWCDSHLPADKTESDDPIVITGQGEYRNEIRPSDLA